MTERLRIGLSVLALLFLCGCYTAGAIGAFPLWDDAWVWLLLEEKGPEAIQASFSDRPINAWLWSALAETGSRFWRASFVSQAVLWPLLGLLSALLWNRLFPELKRYGGLVAVVAVAPFVTKVQMLTANIALASLLPVVLAYAALLLFWRYAESAERSPLLSLGLGAALLATAVLIQEYALPVVLAGSVLLLDLGRRALEPATRRRAFVALGLLVLTAVVVYTAYLLLAAPGSRGDVRPQHALNVGRPLLWYPTTLFAAVWRGLVGGFAHELAALPGHVLALPGAGLFGLLLAGLLFLGSSPYSEPRTLTHRGTWLALVVALVAGLTPVVVMGRVPWDPLEGMTSRYGISVLPILAALMVRTALALINPRWRAVPVVLLGLVAGVTAMSEAGAAIEERRLVGRLGAALQPRVANTTGHTIAVVPLPERPLGPPRQWELVARLAADWPPEQRQRLWAYRSGGGPPLYYKEEATRVLGSRDRCSPPRRIGKRVRLVERQGPVEQVLWVTPGRRERVIIEPYCRGVP
jgi:hypothetical protein